MTRLFTIHEVDEKTPVQFVGVYTMKWRPEWGKPTVMFAEVDDPVYDAAPGLLKRLKDARRAIASLPDDALGIVTAGTERYHYFIKDELLHYIDVELAKAQGAQ